LVDFKALRGDPSDNIPGILGIGEKTAIELIENFGSLENLYQELRENTEKAKKLKPCLRKKLLEQKDQAFVSKMLTQIDKNVPLDFNLEKCGFGDYDRNKIAEIFQKYEFKTLINKLPGKQINPVRKSGFSNGVNNLSLW